MAETDKYELVFRVDSGVHIGSGHLMRCLTLSSHFKNVSFIYCNHPNTPEHLIPHKKYVIKREEIKNETLLGNRWEVDAAKTIDILNKLNKLNNVVLVVDHYGIDFRWEKEIKDKIKIEALVVIDDLYERKHNCDILINQNSNKNLYKNLVPKNCKLLLGYKYLMLNSVFKNNKRVRKRIRRINIFIGGSDKHNVTENILKTFENNNKNIQFDVIIGPSNNRFQDLKRKYSFATFYHDIKPKEMASLFYKSDLCIGAAGTSIYERMASGVFTIVFCVANNQQNCANNLHELKLIEYIGNINSVDIDKLMKKMIIKYNEYINIDNWDNIYDRCIDIVDCNGCNRINEEISNYLRKKPKTNII